MELRQLDINIAQDMGTSYYTFEDIYKKVEFLLKSIQEFNPAKVREYKLILTNMIQLKIEKDKLLFPTSIAIPIDSGYVNYFLITKVVQGILNCKDKQVETKKDIYDSEMNTKWEFQTALDNKTGMIRKFYVCGDLCKEIIQEEPNIVLDKTIRTWEAGVQFPLKERKQ